MKCAVRCDPVGYMGPILLLNWLDLIKFYMNEKTIAILKREEKLKSVRINQELICFYSTPILAMMKTNLTKELRNLIMTWIYCL